MSYKKILPRVLPVVVGQQYNRILLEVHHSKENETLMPISEQQVEVQSAGEQAREYALRRNGLVPKTRPPAESEELAAVRKQVREYLERRKRRGHR